MKLVNKLEVLKGLKPSLFDLMICGILALPFINNPFHRGSYLVFYSLFLLCASFSLPIKNNYRSAPLSLLLITSVVLIFVHHPYRVVEHSIMNMYFNVAMMSEGFIYILAGCILFFTITRYAVNAKFILTMALLASLCPIRFLFINNSQVSLGVSLIMAVTIWLILNKKYRILIDSSIIAFFTLILNWPYVRAKGTCRPEIWMACLREIKQHPFIGYGFNDSVMPDGLFKVGSWNWVYRHNDYLYIWSALGIVAFIAVIWWTIDCLMKIGKTVYLIPFLFLVFLCNMKETMLIPERAAICIVIAACCVKANLKREEV